MTARPPPGGDGGTTRRTVLRASLAASAVVPLHGLLGGGAPAQALSGRPQARWGVQSGEVTTSSGLVWVRSDRRARMIVETSATESFRRVRRRPGPVLGPETDFTGTTALHGLPAGSRVHYRVLLADPDDPRRTGEPVCGSFRTAPGRRSGGLRFLWSGDLAGQGWGINPDRGGYPIFREIRGLNPDFFLNSGDTIYADSPLAPSVPLPDGGVWRNVTTEETPGVRHRVRPAPDVARAAGPPVGVPQRAYAHRCGAVLRRMVQNSPEGAEG